jgi:Holliday junction resolvase RusA-like endonuclease
MPREWKPSKPDGDNVAKLVLDAMNKLVWRDDSQVVLLEVLKMIAAGDEQPHLEITITEVNDEAIPAQKRV